MNNHNHSIENIANKLKETTFSEPALLFFESITPLRGTIASITEIMGPAWKAIDQKSFITTYTLFESKENYDSFLKALEDK